MSNIIKALSNISKSNPTSGKKGFLSSLVGFNPMWPFCVKEPYSGAWQNNVEWTRECVLAHHAVFACITLIASDIAKLRMEIVRKTNDGIWATQPYGNYSVLEKPNDNQTSIQFFEKWILSKTTRGNTYVLKGRNRSGIVDRLYILHPDLVCPLITDDGEVFYQLGQDNLSGLKSSTVVPAREIIHDRYNCLFHDLVGVSPLFSAGLPAYSGLKIQENGASHFKNMSRPSGILTAPGAISDTTAARIKEHWEENYGGENYGRTAVLGDDLKYQPITITAAESQMVEQLKLNSEIICGIYHVPAYKVLGNTPTHDNVGALQQQYFDQCLQIYIESIESCLDEGLSLPEGYETRFDLSGLLRMDQATQIDTLSKAVKGGIMPPNEALKRQNIAPLPGGNTVYLQQQMFSMEALAKRDALENPFDTRTTSQSNQTTVSNDSIIDSNEFASLLRKSVLEIEYHA